MRNKTLAILLDALSATIALFVMVIALVAVARADSGIFDQNADLALPTVNTVSNPRAETLLRVHFDCFLNTGVQCPDLENAFFQENPFVQSWPNAKDAQLTITLRSWNLPPDLEEYVVTFENKPEMPTLKVPPLPIRNNFSSQAKTLELLRNLHQFMKLWDRLVSYKLNPDGTEVVTYRAGDGSVPPPKVDQNQPWIVSINAGLNLSSNGVVNLSAYAIGSVSYDTPTWLVIAGGGGNYNYVSENTSQGTLKAAAGKISGNAGVARSVAGHWSVMVLARETYDPISNFESRAQVHAGIEYELIPFLESNDNAFMVSYIVGGNHENYVAPNVDNKMEETLATHALSLYYVKHKDLYDLTIAAAVSSLVNDPTKFAIGGSASARLHITPAMTIDVSGNVGYKRNNINAPANPDTSNPIYILIGGASAIDPLTYSLNLNMTYTWGNQRLKQQDMRWQFTPFQLPVNF